MSCRWICGSPPSAKLCSVNQKPRSGSSRPEAVAATKRAVLARTVDPVPGLIIEEYEYRQVRSNPFVAERLARAVELGFGTRVAELADMTDLYLDFGTNPNQ